MKVGMRPGMRTGDSRAREVEYGKYQKNDLLLQKRHSFSLPEE
jgi:hypothetical protein